MDARVLIYCLFVFNLCPSLAAIVNDGGLSENSFVAKNLVLDGQVNVNQSAEVGKDLSFADNDFVGRTFGRPFKKLVAGLLPVVFQVGAASTWAVVAALVGVKTLLVTLAILKLLLLAGAAKIGALFASKTHHQPHGHGWEPPHKEIHLHIHGNHATAPTGHEEHLTAGPWSRTEAELEKSYIYNPYAYPTAVGPQTIRTPYGNYVKVE